MGNAGGQVRHGPVDGFRSGADSVGHRVDGFDAGVCRRGGCVSHAAVNACGDAVRDGVPGGEGGGADIREILGDGCVQGGCGCRSQSGDGPAQALRPGEYAAGHSVRQRHASGRGVLCHAGDRRREAPGEAQRRHIPARGCRRGHEVRGGENSACEAVVRVRAVHGQKAAVKLEALCGGCRGVFRRRCQGGSSLRDACCGGFRRLFAAACEKVCDAVQNAGTDSLYGVKRRASQANNTGYDASKDFPAQPDPVDAQKPLNRRVSNLQEHGRQGTEAEDNGFHDSPSEGGPSEVFDNVCSGFKKSLNQIWDVFEHIRNTGRHGLEALSDGGYRVFAKTEPVKRREHIVNGTENFGDICDKDRDCPEQSHSQRCDDAYSSHQQFRGVVVDHPGDIADDGGNRGDNDGNAVRQPLCEIQGEADYPVHQSPGILPDGGTQGEDYIQADCHQHGKVVLNILSEVCHDVQGGVRQNREAVKNPLRQLQE